MSSIREMRQRRGALVREAQALLPAGGAAMPVEHQAKFDRLMNEADELASSIERAERAEQAQRELDTVVHEVRSGRQLVSGQRGGESADEYREAFESYLRYGAVQGRAANTLRTGFRDSTELRAQGLTGNVGGYSVPESFGPELDVALKTISALRTKARILRTSDGRSLPWPTVNDTDNAAAIVGEGVQSDTEDDEAFGSVTFGAFTYRSLIKCSIELLQDSAFDLNAHFRTELGTRVARGTNPHFTTGTGTGQPKGVITAATAGYTAAASNSVAYDDILALVHSVDPAYRQMPGTAFMMNDSTLKALRQLKDSEGRPLWLAGLTERAPDTLLGYPYIINQDMADIEAGAKSMAFGDLGKYVIRDVSDMIVLRLVERYADYGQVGFLVFSRHDGNLLDAGTNPIKYLTHPSP